MHQPVEKIALPTAKDEATVTVDPAESASAYVNDMIARAEAFYRANPTLAVVGAASVAAIGIMALKSRSRPQTLAEQLSVQLRKAAQIPHEGGSEMANNLTSMLTNAMKMEPNTIAAYRSMFEDWMKSLRQKAHEIGTNLPGK